MWVHSEVDFFSLIPLVGGLSPPHRVRCPALALVPPCAFPIIELDLGTRGRLSHWTVSAARQGPGCVLFIIRALRLVLWGPVAGGLEQVDRVCGLRGFLLMYL